MGLEFVDKMHCNLGTQNVEIFLKNWYEVTTILLVETYESDYPR